MTPLRRVLAAATVALALACKGDATGPTPGALTVNLTTPNSGADGAVMFVLNSPAVPSAVTAGAGLTLWGAPVTTTSTNLALTGTLSSGPMLTLQVVDTRQVGQYSVTLIQVAASAAGNFALRPALLTGYAVTITK
jgi:hypothetical protein